MVALFSRRWKKNISYLIVGQRSSPQFSFPPPSQGNDFIGVPSGHDLSGPSANGGLSSANLNVPSQQAADQTASQLVSTASASSQNSAGSSANGGTSGPSQAVPRPPQAAQSQSGVAARQPQSSAPAASQVLASRPQRPPNSSQSAATPGQTVPAPPRSHHHLQQQQVNQQHHLHQQQLAQQQSAIEAARKAEATQASLAAASSGQAYRCPDSFGYFRHHKSCDKYWACDNGTATLKLCGNGLMFDDSDPRRENCAYPFSVDCGPDRTEIEAPISTPHCPRLYGLFADTSNCRVFYSCWNGEASKYECPAGLAYDSEHRVCVWADHVDRCDQSEVSDGFVCPDPTEADQPGHYTRHAHPTDCRKFYVCIEGVARPYGCSIGTVFNVDSLQCDEPENVSGCEKYYGDMDPKLAKKLARENVQQSSGAAPSRREQPSNTNSRGHQQSSATSNNQN